jgi:hypothetical protein
MNARPPFDQLPHEPLDADEAAIARIQRALRSAEPSAALDARILAQARTAIAAPKRRPRPWFMGAGFGAAAAAVMAAGIAWQLGWIGTIPGSASHLPAPAANGAGRTESDADATREERVEIEFIRDQRAAEAVAPPPAPPAPPPPQAKAAPRRQDAAPPPAAAPPPVLEDVAPEPVKQAAPAAPPEPAPQAFPAEPQQTGAPLGAMSREGAERKRDVDEQESEPLDAIQVTGSRVAKSRAALPPWTEDARLDADAWLDRIRERVRLGDRQGAEHSLRRFVLVHPQRAVPRELQRLLVE